MTNQQILIKQRSQSGHLFCLIPAIVIAAFAIMFIPNVYGNEAFWFSSLCALTYWAMRQGYGVRSEISETSDSSPKRTFGLAHPHATFMSYIPFEYITAVELCEYSPWKQSKPPAAYAASLYHYVYTHIGYKGAGIIITYHLPTHMSANSVVRSWQFPAPKAEQFKEILDKHLAHHKTTNKLS